MGPRLTAMPARKPAASGAVTARVAVVTPDYWDDACRHLARRDRVLKRLIPKFGEARLASRGDAFTTLARSIVGQQISVKAAQSVWERFAGCVGGARTHLVPGRVRALSTATMREAGLSARKCEYLLDLAGHFEEGRVHVAEWAGMRVALTAGSVRNIKLTHAEDFERAERLLGGGAMETRTGSGFDVHPFEPGDAVWLGGVKIAHSARLQGHSDADAALHFLSCLVGYTCDAGTLSLRERRTQRLKPRAFMPAVVLLAWISSWRLWRLPIGFCGYLCLNPRKFSK